MPRARFGLDRSGWWVAAAVVGSAVLVVMWWALRVSPHPSATTPLATPTATERLTPTLTPRPTAAPSPSRSPSPSPVAVFEDGRLTLLILGSDSDAERAAEGTGGLTDAITLVSVRADGSGLTVVSVPRDTADVPMPDGTIWTGKINAIAPTLGPAVTADAVGHLLGVEIDHYVQVDMDDLGGIVDAIGGVSVDVSHRLSDAACTIEPGINRFDGGLALCYARHRQTDNDYARAGQQQLLLLAIRDGLLASEIDVRALVGSLGSLQTDLDLAQLDDLAHFARLSQGVPPQLLVLGPPDYTVFVGMAGERGWISTPNVAAIQSSVAALLEAD